MGGNKVVMTPELTATMPCCRGPESQDDSSSSNGSGDGGVPFAVFATTFAISVVVRVAARAAGIGALLEDSLLLGPRLASAACRREVCFMQSQGLSPAHAHGGCAATPPLVLLLRHTISSPAALIELAEFASLVLAEAVCACLLLMPLTISPRQTKSSPLPAESVLCQPGRRLSEGATARMPCAAACAILLFSPWNVGACASGSAAALPSLMAVLATKLAARGHGCASAGALAVGTTISFDHLWLLPALASIAYTAAYANPGTDDATNANADSAEAVSSGKDNELGSTDQKHARCMLTAFRLACAYALWVCILIWLPSEVADLVSCGQPCRDGWTAVAAGADGRLRTALQLWLNGGPLHQPPNMGLWWYLTALAFRPLRGAFAAAMHTLPRLCLLCLVPAAPHTRSPTGTVLHSAGAPPASAARPVAPVSVDRVQQRCLSFALSLIVINATKAEPSLAEVVVGIALLTSLVHPSILSCCQHLPVAVAALLAGALAFPVLHSSWLDRSQLNANFLYFAALLFGAGQLLLAFDLAAACHLTKSWYGFRGRTRGLVQ